MALTIPNDITDKFNNLVNELNYIYSNSYKIISENMDLFERLIKITYRTKYKNTYNIYIGFYDFDNELLKYFASWHNFIYTVINCHYVNIYKNTKQCVISKEPEKIDKFFCKLLYVFDNSIHNNENQSEVAYILFLRQQLFEKNLYVNIDDKIKTMYTEYMKKKRENVFITKTNDIKLTALESYNNCYNELHELIDNSKKFLSNVILFHNIIFGNIGVIFTTNYMNVYDINNTYKFTINDDNKTLQELFKNNYKLNVTYPENGKSFVLPNNFNIYFDSITQMTKINFQDIITKFTKLLGFEIRIEKNCEIIKEEIKKNIAVYFKFFVNYLNLYDILKNDTDKANLIMQILKNYNYLEKIMN